MRVERETIVKAPRTAVFAILAEPQMLLWDVKSINCAAAGPDKWTISGKIRGRQQVVELQRTVREPSTRLIYTAQPRGFATTTTVTCSEVTEGTNVHVEFNITARSFKAKLMMPAVKLARERVGAGLGKALRQMGRGIEKAANRR